MPVPPTIPTSFVPHPSGSPRTHPMFDFGGVFALFGYGALVVVVLVGAVTFGYSLYLQNILDEKTADLEAKNKSLQSEQATVDDLIEFNNRLAESKRLLQQHHAPSELLALVAALTPKTVRLTTLEFVVADSSVNTLKMSGFAETFNALAVYSVEVGNEDRIKNAVFSGTGVSKSGVTFTLTADLDKAITVFKEHATL